MPQRATYGVAARTPGLGVQRHATQLQGGGIPAGMVARWTLDDQAAGYVDLVNGLTLTNNDPVNITTAPGIISNAAQFNGTPNAKLSTPNNVLLQNNGPGFAADCWFNAASSTEAPILAKWGPREWDFYTTTVGRLRILFTVGDFFTPNGTYTLGVWHHLAVVITATNFANVYVNGVLVATSPTPVSSTPGTQSMFIGSRSSATPVFNGLIDEVAIWQFGPSGDPGAAFWLARYNGGAGVRP